MSSYYAVAKSENETVKNFVLFWLVVRVSWRFVCLAFLSARLGSVSSSVFSCDSSFGFSRLLSWWGSFVGVVCAVLPCLDTCINVRSVACAVSALLILRAVYCLYIPALRNLTGFWLAIIRLWITSQCGQNSIVYGGLYVL